MVSFHLSLLLTVLASVALANPFPSTTPKLFCEVVDLAVTLLKAQSTATHFCSAYLSMSTVTTTLGEAKLHGYASTVCREVSRLIFQSTSTITSTTGTTTVTAVVSTTTSLTSTVPTDVVTAPTTITIYTSTSTSTSVVTVTSGTVTVTGYPTGCDAVAATQKNKRAPSAGKSSSSIVKPPCFSAYTSGALLSSACSCLSIPTPTFTATPGPTTIDV